MKHSSHENSDMQKKDTAGKRTVNSKELFKNEREIVIVHGESYYRLQITKAGKLILNK